MRPGDSRGEMRPEKLWIMVDVETSGPRYGRHALLEIGAAYGSRERGVLERFEALLSPTEGEVLTSRGTFARARQHGAPPAHAMRSFADWCAPKRAAGADFIARPAAFDWPWIVRDLV